jgi:hypothetical protein
MWEYRPEVRLIETDLVKYDVEVTDGKIGKLDESSRDAGQAYLVVDTGFWIFGKKRLIPAGVVQRLDDEAEKVFVMLSKDQIKQAPDFDERHRDVRERIRELLRALRPVTPTSTHTPFERVGFQWRADPPATSPQPHPRFLGVRGRRPQRDAPNYMENKLNMKMRTKIVAATVALGLLGGASVASADNPSAEAHRRTVALATEARSSATGPATNVSQPMVAPGSDPASTAALVRNRVGLRAVKPCVFRGTPTRCVIKVHELVRRQNRIVAVGTITPRSNPAVHLPFHKQVIGVRTINGVFGLQQVPAPSCAIVGLVLGPLHLDVLGLVINLARVVLNIIGQTGASNLLSNLLCSLTGILDGGVILARFLSVVNELLAAINAVLAL